MGRYKALLGYCLITSIVLYIASPVAIAQIQEKPQELVNEQQLTRSQNQPVGVGDVKDKKDSCSSSCGTSQSSNEKKSRIALSELKVLSDTARNAIYASEITIAETREFYSEMTKYLLWAAGAFAFIISIGGLASVYFTAKSTAKKIAEAAIQEERKKFSDELKTHLEESAKFHREMKTFKDEALRNLEGFLSITTQLNRFTYWVIEHGPEQDSKRPSVNNIVNPIFKVCTEVLALNPTNNVLLGIVYGTKGIALHLEGKFQAAYESFSKSLDYVPDKPGTLFNIACTACRLRLYDEAISYLSRAVVIEPATASQAREDHDFDDIREHDKFKDIIGNTDDTDKKS